MEIFQSITQYNNSFNNLFANINHKGFSCGFFSLMTVKKFLDDNKYNKCYHEKIIEEAIKFTVTKKIYGGLSFEELIKKYTNLQTKNICVTSVELMINNIIGYEHIFENANNKKYGIIFLKNEKFFVVLYENNKYYVRDCHSDLQYSFNFEDLKNHLNETYQFNKMIEIDGFIDNDFMNFSSIEYIKIHDTFECECNSDISLLSQYDASGNIVLEL